MLPIPRHHRRRTSVVAALVMPLALVACSSDASTRSASGDTSTPTTAAPASVGTAAATTEAASASTTPPADTAGSTPDTTDLIDPTDVTGSTSATTATSDAPPVSVTAPPVPAGVTLRIGDQLDYLKTVLALAGEDQGFPYAIEYSAFVGGPPMLQAFQGEALDAGFIGTTPLIFAQASGLDLRAIAGWATATRSSYGLVTAPGVDDISGWADLKGKTVAYQRGTAGEAVLLQALDEAGLSAGDVTTVDVSQVQVSAALEGGSADAGIQVEPLTSAYLQGHPDAAEVAPALNVTDRTSLFISTTDALEDTGKSAALADYLTRLVRAFAYLADHPADVANGVYVKTYGLTPERAAEIVGQNGPTQFFEVPGELLAAQQHLADLFVDAGQVPTAVDVASSFDERFNALIAATAAEAAS